MSQLADDPAAVAVRAAAWPPDPREACASSEAVLPEAAVAKQQRPLLPQSFDDYDADLELAWLGSILAICQPPPANNGAFSRVFSPLPSEFFYFCSNFSNDLCIAKVKKI